MITSKCDLELFADDFTAHTIRNSVDEVLINLQGGINDLQDYAESNSLTIHPDKM